MGHPKFTRSSAIAEGLRDAPVSTNPATTKHPIKNDCNQQIKVIVIATFT